MRKGVILEQEVVSLRGKRGAPETLFSGGPHRDHGLTLPSLGIIL